MRVVDTSAWIEWMRGSALGESLAPQLPRNEEWVVPTVVQYELARWLMREASDAQASRVLAFTTELVVAPLTTDIATKAADYAALYKLAMADAVIYATASDARADLLTCDAHFAELPNVTYVRKAPVDD
ncbi:putative nucleic acid-binding protein [Roseiarcus fermentans]|uniref:Ribonuclease VapC n=1 Tax=Roseiarcus fermentans TaxID=1473586 RepID=A0A366FX22_9HYPH|nr:type II toxin-antitoxin system VapC family toxin [Roseiarcus fermentans]RBP18285.1 putative nucleic acid-binding protein [Roseiarcus fermentans]